MRLLITCDIEHTHQDRSIPMLCRAECSRRAPKRRAMLKPKKNIRGRPSGTDRFRQTPSITPVKQEIKPPDLSCLNLFANKMTCSFKLYGDLAVF